MAYQFYHFSVPVWNCVHFPNNAGYACNSLISELTVPQYNNAVSLGYSYSIDFSRVAAPEIYNHLGVDAPLSSIVLQSGGFSIYKSFDGQFLLEPESPTMHVYMQQGFIDLNDTVVDFAHHYFYYLVVIVSLLVLTPLLVRKIKQAVTK